MSLACCVGIFPAHRDTESDKLEERVKGAVACARPPAFTGKLNRSLKIKIEDEATNTMSNESWQARNAAAATESNPDFAAPPPTQASTSSYNGKSKEDKDGEFDWRHKPTTAMQRFIMNRSDSSYHAFAGAAGGFMSGIVTCPLDVIKTKLQAQGGFRAQQQMQLAAQANTNLPHGTAPNAHAAPYSGMFGTGKVILREEGVRGLYRGLGPIILGYLPTWAVWFTVYGKSKEYFTEKKCKSNQILLDE